MKHFKTISEFHQFRQMPMPEHPLISITKIDYVGHLPQTTEPFSWVYHFYCIGIKRVSNSKNFRLKYGQGEYDFDQGLISFVAPNQVLSIAVDNIEEELKQSGWLILIHPDFLWNTPLAKTIKQYDFWDYSTREALFLSEKEEAVIIHIIQNIQQEYQGNIDKFSKQIIISQIESLLSYCDRFYHRQFITREKANHQVLERMEILLNAYFNSDDLATKGLPTVEYIAGQLHLSPKYLSNLLKDLTNKNTQQHIHDKLIEKAKEKLSVTDDSISQIAYQLGFRHLPSFSKLFKTKTSQTPLQFRQLFN